MQINFNNCPPSNCQIIFDSQLNRYDLSTQSGAGDAGAIYISGENFNGIVNLPLNIQGVACSDGSARTYAPNYNQPLDLHNNGIILSMYRCSIYNQPISNMPNDFCNAILHSDFYDNNGEPSARYQYRGFALTGVFMNCTNFNQPVTIPNHAVTIDSYFAECHSYNQPVTMPAYAGFCGAMFKNCYNFNQPVNFENANHAFYLGEMFINCYKFNQELNLSHMTIEGTPYNNLFYVTLSHMLRNCRSYNSPFTFPRIVHGYTQLFTDCWKFNQPVNLPEIQADPYNFVNLYAGHELFERCVSFNQPINIPNTFDFCFKMFDLCDRLNSPVNLGNNVTNTSNMFQHCHNFNQPIYISNRVENASNMFEYCYNMNSPITFANDLNPNFSGVDILRHCYSYNQDIYFPDGFNYLRCSAPPAGLLYYCFKYGGTISIPCIINNHPNNPYIHPPFGLGAYLDPHGAMYSDYTWNVAGTYRVNIYHNYRASDNGEQLVHDSYYELINRSPCLNTKIIVRDTGDIAEITPGPVHQEYDISGTVYTGYGWVFRGVEYRKFIIDYNRVTNVTPNWPISSD